MLLVFRILSIGVVLFFGMMGVRWITDPAATAEALGMPLLTGLAASTQIGDIGAFFVAGALFAGWGQLAGRSVWLRAAALMIGLVAVMRTLAWALGHADFARDAVVGELVFVVVLLTSARLRSGEA